MAQHDYVIANGTGAAVRSDLNNGLSAIVTQNSGATEPATTYAFMRWADTTAGVMKMRNSANNAWITLYQLDGEWTNIAFENGTAAAPSIYFKDSGTDTGFYSPGANQVGISTGGTARLTIDSNGNVNIDSNTLYVDAANNRVGLGTSTPTDSNSWGSALLDVRSTSTTGFSGVYSGNSDLSVRGFYGSGGASGSGSVFLGSATNHPLGFYVNNSQKMTLTSTGLGIGTTSPTNGRLNIAATTNQITLDTGDTATYGRLDIGHFSNGTFIGTYAGSNTASDLIRFGTGGSERARIDSSGRLLVGTSSTLAGATDSLLQIRGNSSGTQFAGKVALATDVAAGSIVSGADLGAIYFGNVANGIGGLIECKGDAQWGTNDYPGRLVFSTTADGASSPTERLRIAQNGAWGLAGANYGSSGQVLTSNGSGSAPTWQTASGGKILQIVSTTKTDTFSTSSTSFVDITSFSVSITPQSTSNKILIFVTVNSGAQTRDARYRLVRGSTDIAIGDAASNRTRVTFQGGNNHDASTDTAVMRTATMNFLDSPSSTSSITYKLQISSYANTVYVNRSHIDSDSSDYNRGVSTITVMEVAA